MSVIHNLRSYLLEDNFEIRIYNNMINIVNYTDIGHFDSYKVIVNYNKMMIIIEGENLVVSKLMQDEILVEGNIKKIEFR